MRILVGCEESGVVRDAFNRIHGLMAWDKYKQTLSGLSPEDEAILRSEYRIYCAGFNRDHWKDGIVMSFDEWWRFQADNARED